MPHLKKRCFPASTYAWSWTTPRRRQVSIISSSQYSAPRLSRLFCPQFLCRAPGRGLESAETAPRASRARLDLEPLQGTHDRSTALHAGRFASCVARGSWLVSRSVVFHSSPSLVRLVLLCPSLSCARLLPLRLSASLPVSSDSAAASAAVTRPPAPRWRAAAHTCVPVCTSAVRAR